ncbi:MAG: SEL1-like repeat protein [Candidatus Hydrogenedentes bacterium]|nr:SEL1-like repeat protein [Candidatus Hydrogenedentota bacterium]
MMFRRRAITITTLALFCAFLAAGAAARVPLSAAAAALGPGAAEPTKRAVIIGIDEYEDPELRPSPAALADARAVRDVLISAAEGFPEENTTLLVDDAADPLERPTRNAILTTIRRAASDSQPGDILLVYFAGQILEVEGRYCLVPIDARAGDLAFTAVAYDDFAAQLDESHTKRMFVVLDVGRFGAANSVRVPEGALKAITERGKGCWTIVSCGEGGASYAFDDTSTAFSRFFRDAFGADADSDGDESISAGEASAYCIKMVREWAAAKSIEQVPRLVGKGPDDVLLAKAGSVDADKDLQTQVQYDAADCVRVLMRKNSTEAYHQQVGTSRLPVWLEAAGRGIPEAQYLVGDAYMGGYGVNRDPDEGTRWWRKAAEQGYAPAQSALAGCYLAGEGLPKDINEALLWYRKAAEQNDAVAQLNLGTCYHEGLGVPQDDAEAANWFRKAADQGNATAQNNLGYCYANGIGVDQDDEAAVEWYTKAAEQDHISAQFNLGYCYERGKGVRKSKRDAITWYRKAAEQGNANAKTALERIGIN